MHISKISEFFCIQILLCKYIYIFDSNFSFEKRFRYHFIIGICKRIHCFTKWQLIVFTASLSLQFSEFNRRVNSCEGLYRNGSRTDGIYVLNVGRKQLRVYCDFQHAGGHWVVRTQKKHEKNIEYRCVIKTHQLFMKKHDYRSK